MEDTKEDHKQQPTKKCKACNEEKTLDQYYKTRKYLSGICKKCHNKRTAANNRAHYIPSKPRGFAALPEDKKLRIIEEVNAGKDMMQIAIDNGVHLDRLRSWKKFGKLQPTPPAAEIPAAN